MRLRSIAGLAVCLCATAWTGARAEPVAARKVADTATPIPGGSGAFTGFFAPAFDGSNLAFKGVGAATPAGPQQQGIYLSRGTAGGGAGALDTVADVGTSMPGTEDDFTEFDPFVSVDDGLVAFSGVGGRRGVYLYFDGGRTRIVDTGSPRPEGGTYSFVGQPSISDGRVTFYGESADGTRRNFYTNLTGSITPVMAAVPTSTVGLSGPSMDVRRIAFGRDAGDGSGGGLILYDNGSLSTLAAVGDAAPGGDRFSTFRTPSLDGDDVAFRSQLLNSRETALFARIGGTLLRVADTSTPIPGGDGTFAGFDQASPLSLNDGGLAFVGLGDDGQRGIYYYRDGALGKVIDLADTLDGKPLADLFIGSEALEGRELAFGAVFQDQSRGIYVVTVPEPASFALAAVMVGGLMVRPRRSGKLTSSGRVPRGRWRPDR